MSPPRGTVSGALGQIKQGYQTAAVLTGWRIQPDEGSRAWRLTATVQAVSAYYLTQPDLVFVVVHKTGAWRWPVGSWEQRGTSFTAQLGTLQE